MRVCLGQLQHPFLIIIENGVAVIHILFNMTLQFVNELLLVETINLLRDKWFVMAQCRDNTACQSNSLEEATYLMDTLAYSPAFGYKSFNLFRIYHDRQTGTPKIFAHAFPRHRFACLDEHGKCNNLDVGQPQFFIEECQRILYRHPKLVRQLGALSHVKDSV